ncbi:MAG: aminopeptidase P family protein [Muribaculaceae bacterium]|nr:aminopeptidase P family protein [Muribaculaceae bacterium]
MIKGQSKASESKLLLLSQEEADRRLAKLRAAMHGLGMEYGLITGNSNKYYLTGRVFLGSILVTPSSITYYVRRPVELEGENVVYFRKPEDISVDFPSIALELDELSYNQVIRLTKVFHDDRPGNLSAALRITRAVKTAEEIGMIEGSGVLQDSVYRKIPGLYEQGMSDIELQIEIERASRLEGCLGQFRISGDSMELFMGNVLAGDNADSPSPYDFAMGGAGIDPSIPVGADGTLIKRGMSVMVDVNGNYTGYMTDMTRVFRAGKVSELAEKAHRTSIDIHRLLQSAAKPGTLASDLYNMALELVRERDLESYYMGHRQHAGFIGHGVGIEINELPVIAPRSKDIVAKHNVIALEPKFVIPGTGAVGIENTYVVEGDGMRCVTHAPEEMIDLF